MTALVRRRRRKNPSPLGWAGIILGTVAVVTVAGAGVIFYRMTRM